LPRAAPDTPAASGAGISRQSNCEPVA
jgi:hypothetical protein